MNFLGHIFKLISYTLIFLGVVYLGIENPYRMVSDELKVSANHDLLTDLYNRRGFEGMKRLQMRVLDCFLDRMIRDVHGKSPAQSRSIIPATMILSP